MYVLAKSRPFSLLYFVGEFLKMAFLTATQRIQLMVRPVKFPSCFLSKSDAAIIIARNPLTGHFRDLAD